MLALTSPTRKFALLHISEQLLPRQRNYSTLEKESLALVKGICNFKAYLIGVSYQVIRDHSCLAFLDQMKNTNKYRSRLSLCLQEYAFTVTFRPVQPIETPNICHTESGQCLPLLRKEGDMSGFSNILTLEDSTQGAPLPPPAELGY